jgi:hypothetical protein
MFWSRKKMRLMHWLGRVVNVGDSMAPEFRLIQTVAFFTAVALFSSAWAEPETENYYLKKYGNQTPVQTTVPVGRKNKMEPETKNPFDQFDEATPVQTTVPVAGIKEPEPNDPDYFTKKYGNYKPREPEAPRYREVPLGPGPHVLIIAKRDGAMTRMDYRSGGACQLARDSVRKQAEPPPGVLQPLNREPTLTAVCVPQ